MFIRTYGSAVLGITATKVTIETEISRGGKFYLVGLPDNAVKESQQRMEAALRTNGFRVPGKKNSNQYGTRQIFAKKVLRTTLPLAFQY